MTGREGTNEDQRVDEIHVRKLEDRGWRSEDGEESELFEFEVEVEGEVKLKIKMKFKFRLKKIRWKREITRESEGKVREKEQSWNE